MDLGVYSVLGLWGVFLYKCYKDLQTQDGDNKIQLEQFQMPENQIKNTVSQLFAKLRNFHNQHLQVSETFENFEESEEKVKTSSVPISNNSIGGN